METIFKKAVDTVKEHKEKQKENIKNSVFKKIKGFLDSNNIDTGKKPNIENDEVFGKINQKLKDFGFSPFKSYDLPSPIDNTSIDASNKLQGITNNTSIDASNKLQGITNKLKEITNKLLEFDNEFYESALIRPVSNEVIGILKDKIIQIANTKLRDKLVETVKEETYDDDFEEEPENQSLLNNFKDNLIPIAVKNLKDMLDTRIENIKYEDETYEDDFEQEIDYKDAFKENLTEIAKTNLKLIFDSNLNNIKDLKNALEDVVDVVKPPIKIGDIVVFKPNQEDNQDKWYIGEITGVNDDGTYDIKFGSITYNNVPSHSVVGVKDIIGCKAKYNGRTCKITGINNNGTVTIQYDDGKVEENISGDDIIIEETEILNILENNIPGLSLLLHKSSEKIEELTNTIVQLEHANQEVIQKQSELEQVNEKLIEKQSELEQVNEKLIEKQSELEQINKELSDNQSELRYEINRLESNQSELRDEINRLKRSQNNLINDITRANKIQDELINELRDEVKYNEHSLSDKIERIRDGIYDDLQRITYELYDEIINNREVMQNINHESNIELIEELNKINDINRQYRNQLNNRQYKNPVNSIIDTNNNPTPTVFTFNTSSELNDIIQKLTAELKNLKEELENSKKDRNTVIGYKLSTLASNMLKRKLDSIVTNKNNLVNQNPRLKKQVELLLEAQTLYPHVLLSIYQQELTQKETELKKAINENTKTKGENAKATQVNNEKTTQINNLQNEMNQLKKRLAELEKEKSKNSLANILKKIAMTNLISVLNKPMPIEDGDVVMTEYYNDNENKQNKIESIKVF